MSIILSYNAGRQDIYFLDFFEPKKWFLLIYIFVFAVSIVSTVEECLEAISVETAPIDVEISFNTEEGKFSFSEHL